MSHPILLRRNARAIIASLISYLMLVGPLTPLAAGAPSRAPEAAPRGAASEPARAHAAVPAPLAFVPNITATKTDSFSDPDGDGKADPGQTINYTVTITNNGTTDATGVAFNDTPDPNTTLVPGSISTQPVATDDAFNVVGNVRIQPNAAQGLLANDTDPDTGNNSGLTASGPATTTQGGNLTVNSDGSFSYNPPPGFTGTDTFTYTVSDGSQNDTAVATLTVGNGTGTPGTNVIWFVDPAAAAGGDGRLTTPFNCYTGPAASCFSTTAADDPGDIIFLFSGAHTGGNALQNNQRLVGQGASDSVANIASVTVPAYSDPLPATGGASPTITTTVAATNGVPLAQGNTLRGFTVGNTTGAKIFGNNFGTLTVGSTATPDVTLNGTGQALNLTNGTFAATSAFSSVATTSSPAQGIILTGVAGTAAFGSTTVSGSTTQGILVGTTTANIDFGNTSITGGTDGISFQNNSAGTRTIGTLTRTGGTGAGFIHGAGGGAVNVTGLTAITNPGGTGIQINASNANISFAATSVDKGATAGSCVSITSNAGRTTTFSSLDLNSTNAAGVGLFATTGGTINVTNAAGSEITAPQLIDINVATLGLNFANLGSTNGPASIPAVRVIGAGGSLASATTNIQNPGNFGLNIDGNSAAFNFGNTTVNGSAGTGVFLNNNTGAITFADLDISPDANQTAFHATNNSQTITTTSGDIAANAGAALDIAGASAAARTPLAMALTTVTSANSASASGGVNLNFVSGNLTVGAVGGGTDTNITNPTFFGIQVRNSASGTINFGDATVNGSGGTGVILGTSGGAPNGGNSGSFTFGALNIAPDSGQRGLHALQNSGVITTGSGTVTTTNATAVHVEGVSAASKAQLNVQFTAVNTTGGATAPNGIFLKWASAAGSPGGFSVVGSGGTCTFATPTCTGGRITNTSGADNTTNGIGVYLEDVASVSLTRVRVDGHPNHAVRGRTVNGFTLQTSVVAGNNGTSNTADVDINNGEDSVRFTNLLGTALIDSSVIAGGHTNNLRVVNNTGTLNRLTVSNSTIGDPDGAGAQRGLATLAQGGNDNVNFEAKDGISVMNVTLTNNTLNFGISTLARILNNDNANPVGTVDAVVRGNTMVNANPAASQVVGANVLQVAGLGHVTYEIACNKMANPLGINLLVFKGKQPAGAPAGNFSGTIFNNTVGVTGQVGSGAGNGASAINIDQQGTGTGTVLIKNNVIRNYGEAGIRLNNIDNLGQLSTLNATVVGNLTAEPLPVNGFAGIHVVAGADPATDSSNVTNVKIGGAGAEENDFTLGDPANANDVSLQRVGGPLNLTRPPSISNNVVTVIQDNNTGTPTVIASGVITLVNTVPALPAAINESCTPPAAPETEIVEGDPNAPGETPNNAPDEQEFESFAPSPTVLAAGQLFANPHPAPGQPAEQTASAPSVQTPPASQNSGEGEGEGEGEGGTPPPLDHNGTVHVTIGTLRPGDSVTITFQVTINNPLPAGTTQVSNQGVVSGTNFANVLTDDPAAGGAADPTVTLITVPPDIFARNAKLHEPASGTAPMIFTVALSAPAPAGGVSVNYQTADGGANPAEGGASCGGTVDYVSTGGALTFTSGQQVKTVSVDICSNGDATATPETLLLNLSGASGGNISVASGVGQILLGPPPAGEDLISELRTSGPAGADDEFVEFYNARTTPLTVQATDASAGWSLVALNNGCAGNPVVLGVIPNGTVIPPRGHYLFTGSAYSLANYGGTGAAAGNLTLSAGIADDANVAVFSTSDLTNLTTANVLDAVGFGTNTGGFCDVAREGTTLQPALGSTSEHSFVRKLTVVGNNNPVHQDTNNNSADFQVVSTTPATPVGNNAAPTLGAPGPQNVASPNLKSYTQIGAQVLDPTVAQSQAPNRVRDTTPGPAATSTLGTISIRRTFTNNTGANVTRLRFRIYDISTFPSPVGTADVRAITSSNTTATGPSIGTVTVLGTTLETPPAQPNGGGLHSSFSAGTITAATPLAPGASINLQFLFGVQQSGSFRVFIVVEALP